MINRSIFLYGTFEISETRLVQAFLRPGMTFLDVGAHIGYYTLIAARLVGDTGRVHSFEPGTAMRAHLEANVARNDLHNVEIHAQALAERPARWASTRARWPAIRGSRPSSRRATGAAPVTVPSLSLDDFAASLGGRRIDFLKMDIEGPSCRSFEGGQRLLGGKRRAAHDLRGSRARARRASAAPRSATRSDSCTTRWRTVSSCPTPRRTSRASSPRTKRRTTSPPRTRPSSTRS